MEQWEHLDCVSIQQTIFVNGSGYSSMCRQQESSLVSARCACMVSEARQNGHDVDPTWIPIEPRMATITLDHKTGVACRRNQFPLVQASAVMVHKSQGGTYSSVVYEYIIKDTCKSWYT